MLIYKKKKIITFNSLFNKGTVFDLSPIIGKVRQNFMSNFYNLFKLKSIVQRILRGIEIRLKRCATYR